MATENNSSPGDQLTFDQITALSNNMYNQVQIMENGKLRKLDPKQDTKTIYFEKSRIDALFAANPGSDGLKIYLGVHDSAILTPRQPGYHNKMMVMLVTTTNEVENLTKPGAAHTEKLTYGGGDGGSGGGSGVDDGKLCPPDTGCAH